MAAPSVASARDALRTRCINWVTRRYPVATHEIILHKRRVYILPTVWGYSYALTVLVMLLGAMNYNNSMAFAFTFLLVGLGLNAMWYTQHNLLNITIRREYASPVFAGEQGEFRLELEDSSQVDRYGLVLQWQGHDPCVVDIKAGGTESTILKVPAPHRGILKPGRFKLCSTFPLGLFEAWSWLEFDMAAIVYPKPAMHQGEPPAGLGDSRRVDLVGNSCEDFYGLREYQVGDPLKRVAWKAWAATGNLMSKQFSGASNEDVILDWEFLTDMEEEYRLSVLCGWVLELQRRHVRYGLRLPHKTILPDTGESHDRFCLETLALYDSPNGL